MEMSAKLMVLIHITVKFYMSFNNTKTFWCEFFFLFLFLSSFEHMYIIHAHISRIIWSIVFERCFLFSFPHLIWCSKFALAATIAAFFFLFLLLSKGEREGSRIVLQMLYWKDWRKKLWLSFVTWKLRNSAVVLPAHCVKELLSTAWMDFSVS